VMLTWREAAAADSGVCGGKGYNLGRLARYGFRVPQGGVLPAEAYRVVMREAIRRDAIQNGETADLPESIRSEVREFLRRHGLADVALAVRSSATGEDSAKASFAGVHRSVLSVCGLDAVERAIVTCYSSLWTPHARAYRQRMGFADDDVACAVVICRMVAREGTNAPHCAGVAFSADPQGGLRDRIVIDAVAGSGEAAVSGRIAPQRFTIFLDHGIPVVDPAAAHAPFASSKQLRELAWTVNRIHWALGEGQNPQDIEWAHDGKHLWIVQSRPITALPRAGPKALLRFPQYWSRCNVKDSIPGVICELSWSALQELVSTVAFASPRAAGYEVEAGIELVRRFHGRVYMDLTFLQWVFFDAFGLTPEVILRSLGGHQPMIGVPAGDPLKGPEGKRRRQGQLRLFRKLWGFEKKHAVIFERHIALMRKLADEPLESKTTAELKAILEVVLASQLRIAPMAGIANSANGRWLTPLEELLKRAMGARGTALLAGLSAGSGQISSAEHGYRVTGLALAAQTDREAREWLQSSGDPRSWMKLAAGSPFRQALTRFLSEFGHRASVETDSWNPRWVEDPSSLLDLVRAQLAAGGSTDSRVAATERRLAAEREIRQRRPLLLPLIRWMARGMQRAFAIRELGKSALVSTNLPSRMVILEIGRRLVACGQLEEPQHALDLTWSDLRSWFESFWDGSGARELTADRRRRRQAWLRAEEPDVVPGDGAAALADVTEPAAADGYWRGIAVSSGRATAPARIVVAPDTGAKLEKGEILIAPATDPGWAPLFLRASAVVMETGGYLSHGAIVAREFGLPAVVNIPGILRQLHDGETILVNGDEGLVSRVR
jgi:phosphohistidine swiveling domain-containing protein